MQEAIIHSLTQYYGFDWGAMVATFLSLYCLGQKQRVGFIYGVVAGFFWLGFGIIVRSAASIIANICFIFLNARGYIRWGRENNVTEHAA